MIAPLWIAGAVVLLFFGVLFAILDVARKTRRPVMPQAERPALTPAMLHQLSVADRLRRKAEAQARREAAQVTAHIREFAEAREGAHVR